MGKRTISKAEAAGTSVPVIPGSGEHNLLKNGELMLYGDVGDLWGDGSGFSAKDVVDALTAAKPGPLNVRINSGGGLVTEGFAIYNAVKARGNTTVHVDGIAASAASLISMAADKRVMHGASIMMIHDPSGFTWGTAEDHVKAGDVLDTMGDICAKIYGEAAGISTEDARALMKAETWMNPEDAVDQGFATEVDNTSAESEEGASAALSAFDYMLYEHAPNNVRAAHRALPQGTAARSARMQETTIMTPEEIAAKAAADKLIADAKAVAATIVSDANAGTDAAKATAKVEADKLIANATGAAAKIVADATEAAKAESTKSADATLKIMKRCDAAGLTLTASLEIVTKAAGNVGKAKDLIIDALASTHGDQTRAATPAAVTADARDRFKAGAIEGLAYRVNPATGKFNEFSSMTLKELAKESLRQSGHTKLYTSPMEMIGAAFAPVMAAGYHTNSDFAEVLSNIANKSLLKGWDESEETFQLWTAVGTLVDFKPTKRVDLNLFPSLAKVPEGGEYHYGTTGDRSATVQLATYGNLFSITRQAIINDDLSVFTKVPQKMGRAARRTIGTLVYAVLKDNAVMADGHALFSPEHANLIGTTEGARPTVISVNEMIALMARQKDPEGNADGGLNIRPSFIIVPPELAGVTTALMESANDPAATTPNVVNTVKGVAKTVSDARLTDPDEWYMAANPNQFDTIEVSYLNGVQAPTMEQKVGFNVDGIEFKVRVDAAVTALDHTGLAKNVGA